MKFKVVGIGELLWDLLPGGRQMGGAPANFAYHARALGADARIISRVGNDELGHEIIKQLENLGVPTNCIESDPKLDTGTVSVEVAADGQPHFNIHENVAWDAIRGDSAGRLAAADAHAVCFGTLAQRSQRSRESIRALLEATSRTALRVFDVNIRQDYYSRSLIEESLAFANVLKVSDAELPCLAKMFRLEGPDRAQLEQLGSRYNLPVLACTRGQRGSLLYVEGKWSEHPGMRARVVDTVGAGDSFTAAMIIGLLAGWDRDLINERANQIAAYVCSSAGAMPALPERLCEPFRHAMTETANQLNQAPGKL